ncbi:sugar O-acetyltransferase [Saccharospirillum impatiens]|uniref:sugar O-acetyltransferase n=1 Tax=Saccharospirillum impatiens TaxID=169438 RepID=UPI00040C92F1|nr:sugar O-acetyltransferase [Saccharospirillum impatiens]
MTELEKMRGSAVFNPLDPELRQLRFQARERCARFAHAPTPGNLRRLTTLFDHCGQHTFIEPGVQVDYGTQVRLADRVYLNFGCVLLDSTWIEIGQGSMLGPGVHLYTVSHPLAASERARGDQFAQPIRLGMNVWVGGQAIILPGVTIGDNAVVAAGSVVRESVPANTLVAGNPACRVKELPD